VADAFWVTRTGRWYVYVHSFISLCFIFCMVQLPITDLGRLIVEVLRSHTGSVGRLWTRDRPVEETAAWPYTSTGDRHPCPWRDSNPQPHHTIGCRPCGLCIVYGCLLIQLGMRIGFGLSTWHSCRWDVPRYCAQLLLIVHVNPEMYGLTYVLTHRAMSDVKFTVQRSIDFSLCDCWLA
jgi:hypothetical protein